MKFFILCFSLVVLFSCEGGEFQDNVFEFNDSLVTDSDVIGRLALTTSADSVEVGTTIIFNIESENMSIDSTKFSLDGDTIMEFNFSNFVKSYPYVYNDVGEYTTLAKVFSADSSYLLRKKVVVLKKGSGLNIEEVHVDTLDSLTDGYEEDTTLSIGSAPMIAFIGSKDTIYLTEKDTFVAPQAIAFDDEDGEIEDVFYVEDSILATLPAERILSQTAKATYKTRDSHGNYSTRDLVCIIRHSLFKEDFDFYSPTDIIHSTSGSELVADEGYYSGTGLSKLDTGATTIILNARLVKSDTVQTLLMLETAGEIFFNVKTYNDTLQVSLRNDDEKSATIYVPKFTYDGKLNSYCFVVNDKDFTLYVNGVEYFSKSLGQSFSDLHYSKFMKYRLNVGGNLAGENISKGMFARLRIIKLLLTPEEILELK